MVKTPSGAAAKKATGTAKSSKKKASASASDRPPIQPAAGRPDEHRIRERAYGIWIEEGQPHGRALAHWQRARQELQRDTL